MAGAVDALGLVGTTVEAVRFDACVDSGGFGLVYKGVHTGLDEPVAIKCLRIAGLNTSNEQLREAIAGRFRDETKLLYRLSQGHLDIVRCIGSGTLVAPRTNELTPYMVLEWLEGHTLGVDLRDRRDRSLPPRSLEETIGLLDSAASALAYAHAQGIVHRDIKPGNLFLTQTREGVRMKVLDFGLAKILDQDSLGVQPSVLTGAGVHFCSPSYGAPEQLNAKAGPIGPWTDIYSFTLVLLEVMKGEKVRPATSLAEGLLAALDPATGSPSASQLGLAVPPAVEDLLLRAVSQKPLERPRDAGAFWTALKDAVRTSLPRQAAGARASRPPAGDMGATVADANVEQAMERVREIQAARAATAKPSPFAGTMLMTNAPSGAPHLPGGAPAPMTGAPPSPRPGGPPVNPGPSAPMIGAPGAPMNPGVPPMNPGAPAPMTGAPGAPMNPGVSPMNPGAPAPMTGGPAMAGPGLSPMKPGGPLPMPGAMPAPEIRLAPGGPAPSPLALSVVHAPSQPPPPGKTPSTSPMIPPAPPPPVIIAPGAPPPRAPMAPAPFPPAGATGGPPAQRRAPQSVPPPAMPQPAPKSGGSGLLAFFVFLAVLAIGGFAGWWFYFRRH